MDLRSAIKESSSFGESFASSLQPILLTSGSNTFVDAVLLDEHNLPANHENLLVLYIYDHVRFESYCNEMVKRFSRYTIARG